MVSTERLATMFVEVADTLVDEFDLVDFLHDLADRVADITGASSVGLTLADHNGGLHYMASSSNSARHLELIQLQHDQGPCLECYQTGAPVIVDEVQGHGSRWPSFAAKAQELGVRSVHAFPMRLRGTVLGALNVFGETRLPLEEGDVKIVQAMADVASIAILQERALSNAEVLTEQLQGALNSRVVIEQAKGVVARQFDIGVEEAFTMIRSRARGERRPMVDLAADVVTGSINLSHP
ncbi:ANTAR domain-containing protein [Aeromicrobium sp. CF3.5]|uniref:ANTAR domain-containing protein n=1 Tax=Aeromicrobium sp. CF3.5 TaxID=3373078 RepID=UPI003EE745E0